MKTAKREAKRERRWQVSRTRQAARRQLAEQLHLSAGHLCRALAQGIDADAPVAVQAARLREVALAGGSAELDSLARRLDTRGADWQALVLDDELRRDVDALEARCRQRDRLRANCCRRHSLRASTPACARCSPDRREPARPSPRWCWPNASVCRSTGSTCRRWSASTSARPSATCIACSPPPRRST
jgi:hypothetical protein